MDQSLAMVMLPVADLGNTRRFYEDGLKWIPHGPQGRYSVKYVASGVLVTMIECHYLSEQAGLSLDRQAPGVVLVVNVDSRAAVDSVQSQITAAGGTVSSAARQRDGGLYTFYFTDPDGNPWEVVWTPPR